MDVQQISGVLWESSLSTAKWSIPGWKWNQPDGAKWLRKPSGTETDVDIHCDFSLKEVSSTPMKVL